MLNEMRRGFKLAERLIWTLAGLICLWAAFDALVKGADVFYVVLLAAVGVGFLYYTYWVINIERKKRLEADAGED